ncbi:MAG: CaiB/BaiF CoA transferase family protein [Reyranella sp.]|uniref:CaiB/BaiF CoA transferase family protein n=1 Tax=Reyranella sp. TaxID=1929291 RepID=UPI003D0C42A0
MTTSEASRTVPFKGLRVVDASRVLAGPSCAQLLADMGADVIKIESPEGDENRRWPPLMENGLSSNYASVNRGKRAMTLNMKAPRAREILGKLVTSADVFLHSFLPDTAERLGLSYEAMRALNARLIFCSISGYGAEGPLSNKPGYDLMVQAFAGPMSVTGYDDGPPVRTGVSFVDMATGLSAYGAIVTALYARQHTGQGTWVRTSLLETAVSMLSYHAIGWLQAGIVPRKQGSGGANQAPYQAFRCQDGHVLVGAPNDAAWQRLCTALNDPALAADPRFATNASRLQHRDILVGLLEAHLVRHPGEHWSALLERHGVAVAPIQSLDRVLTGEQVLANRMVVEARDAEDRAWPLLGTPFKIGDSGTAAGSSPALGAHTDEILRELGYSDSDLSSLRRDKVV